MKIGIIADTHIPIKALSIPEKVLKAFKNVDMVIHAGDLIDARTIKQLQKYCPNVKAVCGNMDEHDLKETLPEKQILKIGKYRVGVMHGWGPPNSIIKVLKETFKKDKVDIIIFGHSHNPINEMVDGILFFNPGSPTDTTFAPYNSYGLIELNDEINAKIIRIDNE